MLQLDGLRAIAVLAVAWSHWAPPRWLLGVPWGTGVQLFFVLSGFLITGILIDHRPADGAPLAKRIGVWRSFYIRRLLRIFPLFYLVLVIAWLAGMSPIRSAWPWHAAYLSNFYYFVGHPLDGFRHFWSLSVEEQFYLVWPFLTMLLPRPVLPRVIVAMIVAAPLTRWLAVANGHDLLVTRFLPTSCLDALGIGALLAYARRVPGTGARLADSIARIGLVVGLPGCLLVTLLGRRTELPYAVETLGHTLLVLFYGWLVHRAATGFRGPFGRLLETRPMLLVGRISYGVYVFHFFAPPLAERLGLGTASTAGVVATIAACSLATFAAAMLSWNLYEKPLNDLKRRVPYERP